MNKEQYPTWLVPLDIAQELKEIGFDEPCHFYYQNDYSEYLKAGNPDKYHIISDSLAANRKNANHNNSDIAISAPTWTDVFAWFRERGLHCSIRYLICPVTYSFHIIDNCNWDKGCGNRDTYEEAREACIEELIKIFKENKDRLK